jgi:hypothetical protein
MHPIQRIIPLILVGGRSGKNGLGLDHGDTGWDAHHIDRTRVGIGSTCMLGAEHRHHLIPILRDDLDFEPALRAVKA